MRLRRVRIENHSRLADLDLTIREHLVLVGPNDVGKSSLLRCLDLLLGASTAQLYSRIGPVDFQDPAAPLVIEAELTDFAADEKALFPDEITVDPNDQDCLRVRLDATLDGAENLEIRRTAPDGGTGRLLAREQVAGLGWKMISAASGARDLREDRSTPIDQVLGSLDLGSERADFEALTTALQERLSDSKVLEGLRGRLATQLSRALPEAVAQEDLSFMPGAAAGEDVLGDVRLRMTRAGVPRSLADLSDGMKALVAVAIYDLVSSSANIVAIDEPEVHLHPTSQRSLARLLQAGSNQKIIATHSTDIVSGFDPASVVAIKPGGHAVQPAPGFLTADQRMSVHWWVRDKLEPLTAARVVAVEGVSDRIVLEQAALLTGRELDRLSVSLVSTGGSGDMGAIVKLFGIDGFKVDMSLMIDQDAVAETAKTLGVAPADLKKHSVWVSDPDLEAEYVSAIGSSVLWPALSSSGLFTMNELENCNGTSAGATPSEAQLAEFCRLNSKYKVRSAMVVARVLTPSTAKKIASVESLLSEIG